MQCCHTTRYAKKATNATVFYKVKHKIIDNEMVESFHFI